MIKALLTNIEFYEKLKNDFTFHSSAIEGSTLTYEDNKVVVENPTEIDIKRFHNKYKHDEVQENINCGALFDYVIATVNEKLTERELKIWHNIIKRNTDWVKKNNRSYGDYKKIPNSVGGRQTPQPFEITELMETFFNDLDKLSKYSIDDLADFHCQFETIHPFLDGNGRIGRFILLKQCLQNNIGLFVISNDSRNEYINCLKMYHQTKNVLFLSQYFQKLQKIFQISYSRFLTDKKFNGNEIKIIEFITKYGSITRKQTEKILNLSLSGAAKVIRTLITKNILESHNNTRNTIYKLRQ